MLKKSKYDIVFKVFKLVSVDNSYIKIKMKLPLAPEPLEKDMYFQILSVFLWNNDISGVETRDDETFMEWEKGNIPVEDHIKVIIYFDKVINIESFLFKLKKEVKNIIKDKDLLNDSLSSIQYEINKNEDWRNEWKKFFKPIKISRHIVVKPEWESYEKNKDEFVININPDMAFGTGLHETTKLIVQTIEKIFAENNYNLKSMLDVGAGTGILGMSASMLNNDLEEIDLIEIDSDARRIAKDNIKKNNLKNIKMLDVLIEDTEKTYDLVVSNIISSVLYEIKNELIRKTKNILVLSGVQVVEKDEFIRKFSSDELMLIDSFQLNDWIGLLYIKR